MIEIPRVGHEHAVARRIFICRDVYLAFEHIRAVKEILARGEPARRLLRFQIHQEQLGLRPSLRNVDQQPAIVIGQSHARPIFRVAPLAEDRIVVHWIIAEQMKVNVPVVHLLPVGNLALLRIARVIEPGVVMQPRNRCSTRALDRVRKNRSRLRLDNVQRRHLRSASRSAIRDILPRIARLKPVKRHGAVSRKRIRIHQHTITLCGVRLGIFSRPPGITSGLLRRRTRILPHVKHRLVLHPLALGIEVISPRDLRRRNNPDRKQFR